MCCGLTEGGGVPLRSGLSTRPEGRPVQLHTLIREPRLELLQPFWGVPNGPWCQARFEAEGGQGAGRLADAPLDRMKAETPVGDVSGAEVLAGREQVLHADGNQGAEWNLERQRADIDVVIPARRGMEIDPIAADSDRVGELGRPDVLGPGHLTAGLGADVLLDHREFRHDPPRLPDVRMLGEAVPCPHEIGT